MNTFDLATNFVVAAVETGEEIPSQISLVVKRLGLPRTSAPAALAAGKSGTNASRDQAMEAARASMEALKARFTEEQVDWQQASWIPFTATLPIDLGPGEGKRIIWIAAKWGNTGLQSASGTHVKVDHIPPLVTITNPPERVTSQPIIQLQGYTDEPVQSIRYDLFNASNHLTDVQGAVNEQFYDPVAAEFTTNYFTCYDIELALGTNTIVLRCQDLAGNVATNTLTYLFTLEQDKTPPVFSVDRPINGHELSGDTFTARGRVDDPTAQMTALVWANGKTNIVEGLVERIGYYWVEHIPLGAGANYLTLTATDAAGNSSQTTLVVYRSNDILTIDPVPADLLNRANVTVTGKVSPLNQAVWVNGVQARVSPDGTWVATRVPVLSPNGGTAVFEVIAIPSAGTPAPAASTNQPALPAKSQGLVSVVAGLGTNAVTLNSQQPACGAFSLHLNGAIGRSFILLSSTNLAEWTPILTNLNSQETFDFTDSNLAGYPCRFFRLLPIP